MPDATPPPGVDTTRPSPARIYDYVLGGVDNYQVDRAAAEKMMAVTPGLRELATYSRAWLRRVVQYLCEQGIDQFIDIGSGLPTAVNVHEVASAHQPNARVVYVDNDPSVHVHARALLDDACRTGFVLGDVRDPSTIIESDEVARLIDWSRPVGLVMAAVLHFLGGADDPGGTAARLAEQLPAGSYVAISHVTSDGAPPALLDAIDSIYQGASEYLYVRPRVDIVAMIEAVSRAVGGAVLVEPGLVPVQEWRPDEAVPSPPLTVLGAVLRVTG